LPIYAANGTVVAGNIDYEDYSLTKNVQEIINQEGLDNIRNDLNGRYILLNDMKLDETETGFDVNGWIPTGDNSLHFTGIFSGSNHAITALWIDRPFTDGFGFNVEFFGYIKNAQIKNLGVEITEDKEIKGHYFVGSIAGYINHSDITNNAAINPSVSGNHYANRIVGNKRSTVILTNNFALNSMLVNDIEFSNTEDDLNGTNKTIEQFKIQETYSNSATNGGLGCTHPCRIETDKNNGFRIFTGRSCKSLSNYNLQK
jgi:hypothetical protein